MTDAEKIEKLLASAKGLVSSLETPSSHLRRGAVAMSRKGLKFVIKEIEADASN